MQVLRKYETYKNVMEDSMMEIRYKIQRCNIQNNEAQVDRSCQFALNHRYVRTENVDMGDA